MGGAAPPAVYKPRREKRAAAVGNWSLYERERRVDAMLESSELLSGAEGHGSSRHAKSRQRPRAGGELLDRHRVLVRLRREPVGDRATAVLGAALFARTRAAPLRTDNDPPSGCTRAVRQLETETSGSGTPRAWWQPDASRPGHAAAVITRSHALLRPERGSDAAGRSSSRGGAGAASRSARRSGIRSGQGWAATTGNGPEGFRTVNRAVSQYRRRSASRLRTSWPRLPPRDRAGTQGLAPT